MHCQGVGCLPCFFWLCLFSEASVDIKHCQGIGCMS
jgi:hypothetical protein